MIDLSVLGGFLGAGKTTLVNHLLRGSLERRVAVLVNDFGEISIDAELIAAHEGDTIRLANGCVCCSMGGDLMATLLGLRRRPDPPEHVLVEASGVGQPRKIAQIGMAGRAYRLDSVVVVVDAAAVMALAADRYVGDVVRDQIASADLLLLNKCDLTTVGDRGSLRQWLGDLAPEARIVEAVHGRVPPELVVGPHWRDVRPFPESPGRPPEDAGDHDRKFTSLTFNRRGRFRGEALRALLADLPAGVLRAKGIVAVDDIPGGQALLHVVGRRWQLTPREPGSATHAANRLVLIGVAGQFDAQLIERRLLDAFEPTTG